MALRATLLRRGQERYRCNSQRGWAQNQLQREREKGEGERDIDREREREFTDKERDAQGGETRAMFGMIKNSLFGNTEKTEYKLLSSETKVRGVRAQLPVAPDAHSTLGVWGASRRGVSARITYRFGKRHA